jgi:hypothetical protein
MEAAREVDLVRAEKMRRGERDRRHCACERESGYEPISHETDIGRSW